MKDFFYAIQDLFVDILFAPFDALRAIELDNWWLSNIMSWLFFAAFIVSFMFWMKRLKSANDNNEEDKSISSHSYL